MLAISRFEADHSFEDEGRRVVEFWRGKQGCVFVRLVRNLDEPGLWAIVSEWDNVGAYRRAFQGYDAKMLTPILSRAIDEPSAYLDPSDLGSNVPRQT